MIDDTTQVKTSPQPLKRIAEEQGEILYEAQVTRDPALINQYRLLRKKLYGIDVRFVGFRIFNSIGAEDYDDPDNQMILIANGNRCYGGMSLRISTPKQPVILDLENDILPHPGEYYFALRERLPELELYKYAYAECSRMALHPAIRTREATRRVLRTVIAQCKARRARYLFIIGDITRLRFYKQIGMSLGLPGHLVEHIDIPMRPEYEGIKMHLLCGDMKHFHVTPEDPEARCLLEPIDDYEPY
jgi:hypothetical protein